MRKTSCERIEEKRRRECRVKLNRQISGSESIISVDDLVYVLCGGSIS
jgi:hypothetical protein